MSNRVRARIDMDLKQGELAELMGISQAVVSKVENGLTTINVPDLPRWAAVLNKPITYFVESHSIWMTDYHLTT